MPDKTLTVWLDHVPMGAVTQSRTGDLRFHYDDAYRQRSAPTPLSLSMPLTIPTHRKRAVLPFLAGLLPDNAEALHAIGDAYHVNPRNPFAVVGALGADVAGALEFVPVDAPESQRVDGSEDAAEPLTDSQVADLLRDVIGQYRTGRVRTAPGRFSLAGAQPKLALHRLPGGTWARPLGRTPSTHILKPLSGDWTHIDIVEHLTTRAAALLGLRTAQTAVARFDGISCFITTRYDRQLIDGHWHRLHQEDLGQALSVMPERKYQRDGGPGVVQVAHLLAGLPDEGDRTAIAQDFFAGLMFNTLTHGTDAHIKNYSLMLDGPTVRLAPLYDLVTYAPYEEPGDHTESAMRIGSQYRFDFMSWNDYLAAAAVLHVDEDWAAQTIRHIENHAVDAFAEARAAMGRLGAEADGFAAHTLDAVSRLPTLRASR